VRPIDERGVSRGMEMSTRVRQSLPGSVAALLWALATACGSDDPMSSTPDHSIVITPARLVLGEGMSRRVSANVLDEMGTPISGVDIEFASSNSSIASVTPDGLVSYVGVGNAEIRATAEGLLASAPYAGLRSGHPLAERATFNLLHGDGQGDGPFGAAVDGEGRVFISQTNRGRVASDQYPISGFATRDLGGSPTSIAVLAGGAALVTPTGVDTTEASVIELSSDRVLSQIPLHVRAFSAVTAPDSHTVYLGTNDGRILVFDAVSSQVTGSIDLEVTLSRVNHLALNSAGTLLYASSFTSGTVSEVDVTAGSVVRTFFVGGQPQGVAISPDGTELFVANEGGNGEVDIYDVVGDTLETSIPSGATSSIGGPFALVLSPDGTTVYVGVTTTDGPGKIQVIDVATRTVSQTITSCGTMPRRIAFGLSGGLAVIADESGCVNFVE
jgi:YVTN family beta-propeller protein